jgi:SAM-dependent methyltransferase
MLDMSKWWNLTRRRLTPEIMDDPALDGQRHMAALRGLARINRWSGSVGSVWSAIHALVRGWGGAGPRVLDIATGAGDIPVGLAERARRAGLQLQIDACDASPRALEHARQRAAQARVDVRFFQLDALRQDLPAEYDVLISSLFLHHLPDDAAVQLLRKMSQTSRHLVVVNDLLRDGRGLALAYLGSRVLTRSDVVHVDAVRSVRAAFSYEEVRGLAEQAGLRGATLQQRWPRRFLLTWTR